jgi:glycosyltransferase involved in cell wall biosynthesis
MHFLPHVVPHGIDWEEWEPGENKGYVLWNKNRPTDVCDPAPVTWLANNHPNIPFISTFATPERPLNITTIGVIPHKRMKRFIEEAGVYLSTTKETFGIGILEAMASGVPVLSVARGGAVDLIEHQETGYLAQDWNDLSDGLSYCFEHRERLGAAAREAVKAYSWREACRKVAEVYRLAMREEPPFVTIVIPSFNYAHTVGRAIQSVKNQTWGEFECCIVDDGSTDDTESAVTEAIAGDSRFTYVKQQNAGVANARNNGVAMGTGKYVMCLDADDAVEPTFLETCVNALEEENIGIAYTGLRAVFPDGHMEISAWPDEFDYEGQLKRRNQIPTCCVYRRQMWERLGGYRQRYAPKGAGAEDAELWLRAGANGYDARKVTDDPLFVYSFLTGRVSGNPSYHEVDWTAWHPWVLDKQHPFASIAVPINGHSHPVRQYDEPAVSVIIPVGPGHKSLLVDALDSLEAQTFRKWEAVVINDTGEPLDLTAYPYVTLVKTPGGMGAGYARNRGIEAAKSKRFVCLDADDFLQPQFLTTILEAHGEDTSVWLYTDIYILHPNGATEHYHSEDFDARELWRNGVAPVTCLYTKEMWKDVGGFDEKYNREDWDFHLRLAMKGYCGMHITSPLFTYRHATGKRREEGSVSQEAQRLRALYPLEELQEMCKGCGKNKRRPRQEAAPPPPANWVSKEDLGWPLIEYVGNNQNSLVFKGLTGRKYRFGANDHDKVHRVHPTDAKRFLAYVYFEEAPESAAVMLHAPATIPPPAPAPVAIPTEPIEGTVAEVAQPIELPPLDVSRLTIKELREANYTVDEWSELLAQETAKRKPRSTVVDIIERRIRVLSKE